MDPGENRDSLFPLFVAGVVFVVLAPLFWLGTELPSGKHVDRAFENLDLYEGVYPSYQHAATRLQEKEIPLWDPGLLCGRPFAGSNAVALFQPLCAVFLFLSTEQAMAVHAFLGLFLMGTFFALFVRSLGAGMMPTVIGAMVYTFSGTTAAAMSRPESLSALVWLPLLFWALREFSRESRYRHAVLAGIAAGLLVLSGAYGIALAALFLVMPYAFLRTLPEENKAAPRWRRTFRGVCLGSLLMLGLSAPAWLPAAIRAFALANPAAAFLDTAMAGETAVRAASILPQFLLAEPEALPRVGYIGLATLLFLPAALFHRTGRLEAFFFLAAAIVLLPLAVVGREILQLPLPFTALHFTAAFSLAVVASLGADRLLVAGRDTRSPLVWIPMLLLAASACGLFLIASGPARGRLVPVVVVLLPFFVLRVRWLGVVTGVAVAGLLFADLYSASVNYYQHPYMDAPKCYETRQEAFKSAGGQALRSRVAVVGRPLDAELSAGAGLLTPLRIADGGHLPLTKDQARWWAELCHPEDIDSEAVTARISGEAAHPALLNYMAAYVLLVVGDTPLDIEAWAAKGVRLRAAGTADGVASYINDSSLSRSYWVPGWRAAQNTDRAVAILMEPDFNGTQECVVEAAGSAFTHLVALVPQMTGADAEVDWETVACTVTEESPERVRLQAEAPRPGVVVLADSYAPGWRVTLDGESAPMLKVNGLFRGVAIPAGSHTIEFTYRPLDFFAGVGVGAATLVIFLAGCLWAMRPWKRRAKKTAGDNVK